MMKNMDPELYLGLGDYSYQNSPDCWINIIKSVDNLFRIAVGNHDAQDQLLKDYMNKFKLDEQYYSFNYLNAHFIALSTELDKGGEVEQRRFLKNDLWRTYLNHSIDWTIVFFHKPFYSADESSTTNMRRTYHPLFDKFGVDIVLQGHSHNYQRSYPLHYNDKIHSEPIISEKEEANYNDPSGTIFIIVGTGGEALQPTVNENFLAKVYEGYGCINVEIHGKSMMIEFYSDMNNKIDKFSIIKDQHDLKRSDLKSNIERIDYNK